MTAGCVMDRARELRPTAISPQAIYDELSRVESMISEEVLHEGPVRLLVGTDEETELLAGPPYDGMYLHYICAKLDQMVQEYQSANTEMTVFQGLYDEFAKWYRRTHPPPRGAEVHGYV